MRNMHASNECAWRSRIKLRLFVKSILMGTESASRTAPVFHVTVAEARYTIREYTTNDESEKFSRRAHNLWSIPLGQALVYKFHT